MGHRKSYNTKLNKRKKVNGENRWKARFTFYCVWGLVGRGLYSDLFFNHKLGGNGLVEREAGKAVGDERGGKGVEEKG